MIICLEGINGSGKTTLAQALAVEWTRVAGARMHMIEPVQATAFGRHLRAGIMQENDLDAVAEALAFASARLHAAPAIRALATGSPDDLFVVERWAGAVVAYGHVAGADTGLLSVLERILAGSLPVDRTFLVDTSGATADARLRDEESPNRFETQGARYLENVGAAYRSWARASGVLTLHGASKDIQGQVRSIVLQIQAVAPAASASPSQSAAVQSQHEQPSGRRAG